MNFTSKAILGVIGALILGGLGNGVWEYILKPVIAWSYTGVLNVATLGILKFKDDLYREIAKGFHEESSLALASAFYFVLGYFVAGGLFLLKKRAKGLVGDVERGGQELEALELEMNGQGTINRQDEDLNVRISRLRKENSKLLRKAVVAHRGTYFLFAFGVAFFAWTVIGSVKDRYINTAIVHYEQSVNVIAPFVSERDLIILRSRFARVSSKEDYELLMSDIRHVGEKNGVMLAKFSTW